MIGSYFPLKSASLPLEWSAWPISNKSRFDQYRVLGSIVVSIRACHHDSLFARDPGSIPGREAYFLFRNGLVDFVVTLCFT